MLNKRTNVLFSEDEYETLVRLAKKREKTMGELVRQAVRKTYKVESKRKKEIKKRTLAFNSIKKLRKEINTEEINYRELINYGRRY